MSASQSVGTTVTRCRVAQLLGARAQHRAEEEEQEEEEEGGGMH